MSVIRAHDNIRAFLDMIALSEGTPQIPNGDDGYKVIVGSTPATPILMTSYADHPRKLIELPNIKIKSTAAGRYQLLARYFDPYKAILKLKDFSPLSQDLIACQQIREKKAMDAIIDGHIEVAIALCSGLWASLPGNKYKQRQNSIKILTALYLNAGGQLA